MTRRYTRFPLLLTLLTGCVSNPHLMEAEPQTGFEIYRTGRLTQAEFAALCEVGVRQMVVMDGSADRRECAWRDEMCPEMVVRYNREQDTSTTGRAAPRRSSASARPRWTRGCRPARRGSSGTCAAKRQRAEVARVLRRSPDRSSLGLSAGGAAIIGPVALG